MFPDGRPPPRGFAPGARTRLSLRPLLRLSRTRPFRRSPGRAGRKSCRKECRKSCRKECRSPALRLRRVLPFPASLRPASPRWSCTAASAATASIRAASSTGARRGAGKWAASSYATGGPLSAAGKSMSARQIPGRPCRRRLLRNCSRLPARLPEQRKSARLEAGPRSPQLYACLPTALRQPPGFRPTACRRRVLTLSVLCLKQPFRSAGWPGRGPLPCIRLWCASATSSPG